MRCQCQLYLLPLTCAKAATVGGTANDELGQLERLIDRQIICRYWVCSVAMMKNGQIAE
jgi:hypothetical protein